MLPKKSLRSRYSISQVNNNNYQTITVGSKSASSSGVGYVWVPYIMSTSPGVVSSSFSGFTIESTKEMRKSKIQNIIDKL